MIVTVNGRALKGTVEAIASKAMAHRYLICSALSENVTRIRCETRSDDISATAQCLSKLGAQLSYSDGGYFAGRGEIRKRASLDCGESAQTLRFLLPVTAALGCGAAFHRGARLRVRRFDAVAKELKNHGVSVSEVGSDPLCIGGKLTAGYYELPGEVSPQFVSGFLFALPMCDGNSVLNITGKMKEDRQIKMTLSALKSFGIEIKETANGYEIPGNRKYISPGTAPSDGDWSTGALWIASKMLGADIEVSGLSENSLQGDRAVALAFEKLKGSGKVLLDAAEITDMVPTLAVVAAARKGSTVIFNTGEADGTDAVCKMLFSLGAGCVLAEDGIKISGGTLHSGNVNTFGDHRIAMAAALASTVAGDVTINGAEAVSKSYPAFWEDFRRLGGTVVFSD